MIWLPVRKLLAVKSIGASSLEGLRSVVAGLTAIAPDCVPFSDVIGVPITFLDKYNPDQFEIIGATESEGRGFSQGLWNAESGVMQPLVNGNRKYKRIFIRRK